MARPSQPTLGSLHSLVAGLTPLQSLGLSFVCGVLTLFAFAPFNIWPVYILSVSLLVWLLDGAHAKPHWGRAMFARGWAFGAGFTIASMHWTASPFLVDPVRHIWFIWMPLILLPAGLGLFFGAGSLAAGRFWNKTPGRIFLFAVCLSLSEALRGIVFGGFPWNWPGMIWVPGDAISQTASLVGLWGLSILTLMLAASPAALADYRPSAAAFGRVAPLLIGVVVFVTAWAWGSQRLQHQEQDTLTSVRIVDAQIDQMQKYPVSPDGNPVETARLRQQAAIDILNAYLIGTGDDFPDEPRLVVWPEAALPMPLLQDPDALDATTLQLGDRTLIVGTSRIERQPDGDTNWFNSLAVLNERSRFSGPLAIYDKHRLVPFGELAAADFIPFGHAISAILPGALQQQATAGFAPGPAATPLRLDDRTTFLPLICYEALFPGLVRRTAGDSHFIVNISIDSWFGEGVGPQQHYAHARYRAIETGRPLVRAANMGVSAVVNAYGREVASVTSLKTHKLVPLKVVDSTVPSQKISTTYSRFGIVFSSIAIVILIMFTYFYGRKT